MSEASGDKVKIKEIVRLLWRRKAGFAAIVAVAAGFAVGLSAFLPKTYQTEFEINVYSKYFQNPLISEIVPGVYNIPEMRFTIDSMVKEALSDRFMDQLAQDFGIYSLDASPEEIAKKRGMFRERFKHYSTGGQSYRVVYEGPDPYQAKRIAEKTLDRVRGRFIDSRIQTIETVKSIMLDRLRALSASRRLGERGSDKALASRSPEALRAELAKIKANISALSKQYNMNHPKLRRLESRKRTIETWLEEFKGDLAGLRAQEEAVSLPADKEATAALAGKFLAKFHDFNMALDIEKRSLESYFGVIKNPQLPVVPIWPKKRLFAALGLLLGLVFGFLYIFVKELLEPGREEMIKAEARRLNCAYLGAFAPPPLESAAEEPKSEFFERMARISARQL